MRIDEIESSIRMCRSALIEVEGIDSVLTPVFTRFLLIEVVAKFENKFNELIRERFKNTDDESAVYFFIFLAMRSWLKT